MAQSLANEGVEVRVVAPSASGLPSSEMMGTVAVDRFRYAPRKYETLAYTGTMVEDVRRSWSARFAMVGFLGADFVSAVRERRSFEPDIVHAHWWFPGGLVGAWVSGLSNIPLVTTLHGTDLRMARNVAAARPLARRVLQQSTVVTTVSNWLAKETAPLMSGGAVPLVAPMSVSTDVFVPSGEHDAQRLLFVGRLNAQKGIEYAIRALAQLRATAATLDVVGSGSESAESQYRVLAGELGVAERVTFHGALSQQQLVPLYQRATLLVMPSIDEGLGLVAVESLLCETPVVAFDSGGVTDVVIPGKTGVLVPPRDVGALSRAIAELLGNPEQTRALGRAGRLYALSVFAPESVARRYADVYHHALRTRAS
jgi:glycosyltransferase involved in cell wall biosynthesis